MMDDDECEAPSFSLGFDLDSPTHDPTTLIVPDSGSDPDTRPDPPPRRILKRLRRGLPSPSSVRRQTEPPPSFVVDIKVDDDDIEEFSSQDEPVQGSSISSFFVLFFFFFFFSFLSVFSL